MHHTFLVHSSVDRHLGRFYIQDVVNHTTVNVGVQVSLWNTRFISCGYNPGLLRRGFFCLSIDWWGCKGVMVLFCILSCCVREAEARLLYVASPPSLLRPLKAFFPCSERHCQPGCCCPQFSKPELISHIQGRSKAGNLVLILTSKSCSPIYFCLK